MTSFTQWLTERNAHIGPGPAELLSIIADAGPNGITRKELGHVYTLPVELLNQLLAAYSSVGLVQVHRRGEETVYRTLSWLGNRML